MKYVRLYTDGGCAAMARPVTTSAPLAVSSSYRKNIHQGNTESLSQYHQQPDGLLAVIHKIQGCSRALRGVVIPQLIHAYNGQYLQQELDFGLEGQKLEPRQAGP